MTVQTAGGSITSGSPQSTQTNQISNLKSPSANSGEIKPISALADDELLQKYLELGKQSEQVSNHLAFLTAGLRTIREEQWKRKFGIFPGCLVQVKRVDRKFKVDFIHHDTWASPDNKPWVHGFRIRKDGTPSEKSQHLFTEWEIIK
jgi:hypothetical protein